MAGEQVQAANAAGLEREVLARSPIFAGLPEDVLGRILGAARRVEVGAGHRVIEEGEAAVNMFVVAEGELEICKRGRNGAEFCLAVLKRGDCVGEMSLIDIQPRSATVKAVGPAALLMLDQAAIARLYQTDLEVYTLLVLNIAREISRRLRQADQALVDVGLAVQVQSGIEEPEPDEENPREGVDPAGARSSS